jgi:hypothetical protein
MILFLILIYFFIQIAKMRPLFLIIVVTVFQRLNCGSVSPSVTLTDVDYFSSRNSYLYPDYFEFNSDT